MAKHSLIKQYEKDSQMKISHSNLPEQFCHLKEEIYSRIDKLVLDGDYTLGKSVEEFEDNIKELLNINYVLGLNSGTDALFLSLKALGVGKGDEVITTPFTFFATVGAIGSLGATPVFVDIGEDLNINPDLIEKAITPKTKVILPVHWAGLPCDMDKIKKIAEKNKLYVIEDSCQSILAETNGIKTGCFGDVGCFSMHPLKNLNVWGDGGFITTNSKEIYEKIRLLRNHGLVGRNETVIYGHNSRLDSIQAIVANVKMKELKEITNKRIENANFYNCSLWEVSSITLPPINSHTKHVFHLYIIKVSEGRDKLKRFLNEEKKIDAKIHYPIPMHLQRSTKHLGYNKGDFPVAEDLSSKILSLPVNESLTPEQLKYVVDSIKEFYSKKDG